MAAKSIIDVYPVRSFCIFIVNLGKVDGSRPKHKNIFVVAIPPQQIVQLKGKRLSHYLPMKSLEVLAR